MGSFVEIEEDTYINMAQVRSIARPEEDCVSITWSNGEQQQFTGEGCTRVMAWLLPKTA